MAAHVASCKHCAQVSGSIVRKLICYLRREMIVHSLGVGPLYTGAAGRTTYGRKYVVTFKDGLRGRLAAAADKRCVDIHAVSLAQVHSGASS